MMLHPGRLVEHQSASSCRAGRCVVVRPTRCRVPSVESPVVPFCTVFSHTPPRHGHDCGPVDLERNFAPLVAHRTR